MVIRFTQDGIPVKVTPVPLVGATAVLNVLTELVAVAASSVSVFVPATAGADTVIAPLVSPEIITEDIFFLYKTTQREPEGTVTVTVVVIAPLIAVCDGLTT